MTSAIPPEIDDFDLFDYADGRMDADPVRLARFEAALAASPGLAARAEALRHQTQALREAYAPAVDAPVPTHLSALVERPPRRQGLVVRPAAAAAAAAAVLAAGWFGGQAWTGDGGAQGAMIEAARESVLAPEGPSRVSSTTAPGRPLDLTPYGYSFVDQSVIQVGGQRARAAIYVAADGRRVSILSRGAAAPASINIESRDDVSVAFWPAGPDAAVVASTASPEETLTIARAVRAMMTGPAEAPASPAPPALNLPMGGTPSLVTFPQSVD